MENKIQDLAWACLPKEVREEARMLYKTQRYDARYALERLYGCHNLTSDTEPEEMLTVKRKKVQDKYSQLASYVANKRNPRDNREEALREITLLKNLFGGKCLPDKELEHRLEQTVQESVQVEPKPKFKVGDKVVICSKPYDIKWDGIVKTIKSVELNEDGEFVYSFYDYSYNIVEDTFPHLIPYTEEPETKSKEAKETQNLSLSDIQSTENKEPMEEKELGKEDNFPTKELTLSDEELDKIIFELIRIRDNRRENDRQLVEVLDKLKQNAKQ